jgi:sporulation protein YlmC with PRC-barrel domain
MPNLPSIGAMTLVAALLAAPGIAQQSSQTPPATPDQPQATDQHAALPATQPPAVIPGVPPEANPNLVVAAVKLKNGFRASKLIGAPVFNDQNQKIGSIDDLIVAPDEKVTMAVISVGGFLGIGSKLVAIPYDQLHFQPTKDNGERFELPGATKEALNSMPNFTYGNG